MEKRFYLNIINGTINHNVVPVEVVSENEETLRVRLLKDYKTREPITGRELEAMAKAGDEFEMPNNANGRSLRDELKTLGDEYGIPVPLADATGKNGYRGLISLRKA